MTRRLLECDYEGGTTKNTNMCTRTTNGGIDLPTHHPLPLCTFLRVFFLPLGPFFQTDACRSNKAENIDQLVPFHLTFQANHACSALTIY